MSRKYTAEQKLSRILTLLEGMRDTHFQEAQSPRIGNGETPVSIAKTLHHRSFNETTNLIRIIKDK